MPFTDFRRPARLVLPSLALAALAACQSGPDPASPAARAAAADYQRRIALQLVARNPSITYTSEVEDELLGIPVLSIEVDAGGAVRDIEVMRRPSDPDAQDTVQIAIDAVRRAAPFGPPPAGAARPWKFVEVLLFDHQRRFKPQVLD